MSEIWKPVVGFEGYYDVSTRKKGKFTSRLEMLLQDNRMTKYVTNLTDILRAVSKQYGIPEAVLTSSLQTKPVAYARHIAVYLACNLTYLSKNDIAARFNQKDHSSLYYGYKKITNLLAKDAALKSQIADLVKKLS